MKKQISSSVSLSVMKQIKSGKVHMKPRLYFALLGLISGGSVILAGVTITYLSSIMFFWFRILTADTMAYGARAKLSESITSFPWWALVAALLLLAAAVLLVRRQRQMYKHKTSSIVLVISACSLLLGFVISLFNIGSPHIPNQFNKPGQGQGQGWQQNR